LGFFEGSRIEKSEEENPVENEKVVIIRKG
jgi:hypothetical protein